MHVEGLVSRLERTYRYCTMYIGALWESESTTKNKTLKISAKTVHSTVAHNYGQLSGDAL
jgi:hypothetical protein